MILLDTDILIDILRQYKPAIDWLKAVGDTKIILPGFVVMELIQGCRNSTEQKELEKMYSDYNVVWPSVEMCENALSVFARFHLSHRIGIIDTLIGQMSVSLTLPLHTFNQKHYEAIPGIRTDQPYKKSS